MRLFAALAPSPEAVAHLELALAGVRGSATTQPALRWADPRQWHITLAFYGEVPDGAWPGLAEALGERIGPAPAPRLHLSGAGSFAGRTLWVGVSGPADRDRRALSGLVAAATAAGVDTGLSADERTRHRPHLTLARATGRATGRTSRRRERAEPSQIPAIVRALAVYSGPSWRGSPALLVRSRLGEGRSGGALHEVVAALAPRG